MFCSVFGVCAWRLGWTHAPASGRICDVLLNNYQPGSAAETSDSEPLNLSLLAPPLPVEP